jgi:hypothetical protein
MEVRDDGVHNACSTPGYFLQPVGNAGVLFAAEINMFLSGQANCSAGAWVISNGNWVSTIGAIPTGWQRPGFDDSQWPLVVAENRELVPTRHAAFFFLPLKAITTV